MNKYICKVSDKNGKILKFNRMGISVKTIQTGLQKEGYFPVSILVKNKNNTLKKSRVLMKAIADFTALLSMLLDSGLGIKDGLEILKTITGDPKVESLVNSIEKDIEAGYSFFSSIQNIGHSLPALYGSMVKVGETTGDLAFVFRKINDYLARQKRLREKLLSSLIYPVIVLIVAVFSMVLISAFIIPKMAEMFTELGSGVPEQVNRVLFFSQGIFNSFLIAIPLIMLLGFAISLQLKRSSNFAVGIDRIKLIIPFFGSFSKDNHFLNIMFTLDALTSCGITIEDSIKEVIITAGNAAIKEAFIRVHEKVLKGVDLSDALYDEKIIPLRISKWIAVGEKTGSMGKVFNQLSGYYENELGKKSTRFMSIIEPALIIFTGLIVFGIVLLVIIPLFSTFGTLLE